MDVLIPVNVPAGWGAGEAAAPALGDIVTTDALTATGAVGAAIDAFGDIGSGTGQTPLGDFLLIISHSYSLISLTLQELSTQ